MKKKMLSLLLAATMVIAMCACGNSKETQNQPETSETNQTIAVSSETKQVESEADGEDSLYPLVDTPVTVKGVFIGTNSSDKESRIVWDKVSEITGINIEWEVINPEALATYLASGDWPDFFHGRLDNSMIYDYGVLGGKLVNYLEYLEVMPNLVQTMEDYPMAKNGFVLTNGAMYKLPYVDKSVTATKVRPYVDTAVLEKAGVKMPTTVEEFEQALKDLKEYYGIVSFIPKLNNYANTWARHGST